MSTRPACTFCIEYHDGDDSFLCSEECPHYTLTPLERAPFDHIEKHVMHSANSTNTLNTTGLQTIITLPRIVRITKTTT